MILGFRPRRTLENTFIGRVVESGPVRSIFYSPQHEYTRSLLNDILEEGHARGPFTGAPSAPSRPNPSRIGTKS